MIFPALKTLKAGALAICLIAVISSYFVTYQKGHKAGADEFAAKALREAQDAASRARIGQESADRRLTHETDNIIADSKDGDGPLAVVLSNQLDRMREFQSRHPRP